MIPAALAPVVAHLWQSTLFACVAALLTLALRRNQARALLAVVRGLVQIPDSLFIVGKHWPDVSMASGFRVFAARMVSLNANG